MLNCLLRIESICIGCPVLTYSGNLYLLVPGIIVLWGTLISSTIVILINNRILLIYLGQRQRQFDLFLYNILDSVRVRVCVLVI